MSVVRLLLAEEVELQNAASVGQPQQPVRVEYRPVDVTDDRPLDRPAVRDDEARDLLRLVGMPARMDVDGQPRLLLRQNRPPHHPLLERRPRRLAADLPDDARAHAGAHAPSNAAAIISRAKSSTVLCRFSAAWNSST